MKKRGQGANDFPSKAYTNSIQAYPINREFKSEQMVLWYAELGLNKVYDDVLLGSSEPELSS